jgi:hypothetical protein
MVTITDDVQGVANRLAEIDSSIRLRYSEAGEYWVVYVMPPGEEEGSGYVLTTSQDLDMRLAERVAEVYWKYRQPGYSLSAEIDANDEAAKKQADHEFTEHNGEMYERLAHAIRKDLGYKSRAFFTK